MESDMLSYLKKLVTKQEKVVPATTSEKHPKKNKKLVGVWNVGNIKNLQRKNDLPPKDPDCIRFVCLSDTHNKQDDIILPEGDVLLHTGDFSLKGRLEEVKKFTTWFEKQPFKYKIVIAGNHDLTFEIDYYRNSWRGFHSSKEDPVAVKSILTQSKHCIYLEDSEVEVEGIKIYGSPWQPTFFNWAFNLDRGAPIKQKWDLIPPDVDILLTHGPAKGHGGKTSDGVDAGCADLLDAIGRVKPLVHVCGHIHEGYGVTSTKGTTFINASTCTLKYQATNLPIVFDIKLEPIELNETTIDNKE